MNIDQYKKEKIGKRGNIGIWIVDGKKIRDELDIEFTNFGQHYRFSYIPENEFWLDREASPNEKNYFIDHLLVEWKMMKEGIIYTDAIIAADETELKERSRGEHAKRTLDTKSRLELKDIHIKLYGVAGELNVWIVNGKTIRSNFNIDYTEGGHDLVYDFVPENEVWLDDDLKDEEKPYVLLHELKERASMKSGYSYEDAHYGTKENIGASEIEWEARHNPEKLAGFLKELDFEI